MKEFDNDAIRLFDNGKMEGWKNGRLEFVTGNCLLPTGNW